MESKPRPLNVSVFLFIQALEAFEELVFVLFLYADPGI